MDSELRKSQLLQLQIALEIKRVCQLHQIPYFMIAGTLLGAVRHKGFIPWDDDMDIGMLREDYDRFVQACKVDLDSRYFLQTWDTDSHFGLPFAKLMLKGTAYVERNAVKVDCQKGIFVDVFPFDNVPEDEEKQKKQDRDTYLLKRLILARNGYQVWEPGQGGKKAVYGFLSAAAHLLPLSVLHNRLLRKMTAYNGEKTQKIVTFGGSYGYQKESIRREWAENVREIPFEDAMLSAPVDYDGYLRAFYGDYMTPPPEEKRGDRHNIVNIDFGEYTD